MFTGGFAAGLLGFAHCMGMCGGLSAALGMGRKGLAGFLFLVFYQVGRISTYTMLGWGGATIGAAILFHPWFTTTAKFILVGSDLLVIILCLAGLGLLPWLRLPISEPEGLTGALSGLVRLCRLAPAPVAATLLGLAMGLLPCGLLYPVLINAVITADPAQGALTMLGFGLGTAPALLLFGATASRLRGYSMSFLRLAWVVVGAMGVYNLYHHLEGWSRLGSCCG